MFVELFRSVMHVGGNLGSGYSQSLIKKTQHIKLCRINRKMIVKLVQHTCRDECLTNLILYPRFTRHTNCYQDLVMYQLSCSNKSKFYMMRSNSQVYSSVHQFMFSKDDTKSCTKSPSYFYDLWKKGTFRLLRAKLIQLPNFKRINFYNNVLIK